MPIFVSSRLNGLTSASVRGLSMLGQDYATVEDYENLNGLRRMLVEDMARAVEAGDPSRLDYLDELYDEICQVCDELAECFPERAFLE